MPSRSIRIRRLVLWAFGMLGLVFPLIAGAANELCLLEPLPGGPKCIPAGSTSNMGAFFIYVNNGLWGWAFGIGIGIAVLNCTFAGLQIVFSNGESGVIDKGKTRFMWSTAGLLMLLLAGTILQFINPAGFVS